MKCSMDKISTPEIIEMIMRSVYDRTTTQTRVNNTMWRVEFEYIMQTRGLNKTGQMTIFIFLTDTNNDKNEQSQTPKI